MSKDTIRPISNDELKVLQLNILKKVHDFCTKLGIRYSLAFGTMLGAVRHGGYIPWDDIDILMPRKDYEIFLNLFKDERYKVLSYPAREKFPIPFAKVMDNETILVEYSTIDYPIGVNIDVFPVDSCPPDDVVDRWFKLKRFIDNIYSVRNLRINSKRGLSKNLVILAVRLATFPFTKGRLCQIIQEMATQYNNNLNTDKKAVLSTGDTKRKWMSNPAKIFDSYKTIEFEGLNFCCIENTDEYLRNTYGDYMKLPPENQRVSHHGFEAFWKN